MMVMYVYMVLIMTMLEQLKFVLMENGAQSVMLTLISLMLLQYALN